MKRFFRLVPLVLAISSFQALASERQVYGGFAAMPFGASGLKTIAVSDWEKYGLKSTNPSSAEGRVRLDLGSANTDNALRYGALIGFETEISDIPMGADLSGYAADKLTAFRLSFNARVPIWNITEKTVLSFSPSLGLLVGMADLGKVKQISGYTDPVIVSEGTFKNDDALSASITGVSVGGAATLVQPIMDKLSLRLDLGFQYGFLGSFQVKAGDIELQKDSKALVNDDGSSTPANLNATGKSVGMIFTTGIQYSIDD